MNLIGLDRKALRQVHGVEWDHVALGAADHETGRPAFTRRHQRQSVAVLFDLDRQRGDALLLKQAQAADAAREVFLLVDGSSQRRDRKRIIVKDFNVSHVAISRKQKTRSGRVE